MKEYYEKPAISNSGMASINPAQGGTPARYKKYIVDREKEEEETPSLENGKLIHLYVEDPKAFVVSDVDKPTGKLGEWVEKVFELCNESWDEGYVNEDNLTLKKLAVQVMPKFGNTTDEDKLWKKFQEGFDYLKHLMLINDELCITSKQKEIVENCIASLRSNPIAEDLLFKTGEDFGDEAHNELPIYWSDQINLDGEMVDVDCKALLDRVKLYPSKKHAKIVDLKTTSRGVAKFKDSFEKWRYYRQMAWYLRALYQYLETRFGDFKDWSVHVIMVVVETTGLHETKVFEVGPHYMAAGDEEVFNLVGRIAFAQKTNNWTQSIEEIAKGVITLIPDDARTQIQPKQASVESSGLPESGTDDKGSRVRS